MDHTRGKPYHPQTQGKIERYHRTMKNVVKLQNYYQSEVLEREIARFVETPADVYCGRDRQILIARWLLKMQTLRRRRCCNNGCDPGEEELIRPSAIREGVL